MVFFAKKKHLLFGKKKLRIWGVLIEYTTTRLLFCFSALLLVCFSATKNCHAVFVKLGQPYLSRTPNKSTFLGKTLIFLLQVRC